VVEAEAVLVRQVMAKAEVLALAVAVWGYWGKEQVAPEAFLLLGAAAAADQVVPMPIMLLV
jgi:hypothetical protein